MRQNALWNCKNPHQGTEPRVLAVCSAGLLRSPSIAKFLVNKGYNCRSAGIHDYALIRVDEVLLAWADIVVFAQEEHKASIRGKLRKILNAKSVFVLGIPDIYPYGDEALMKEIERALDNKGFYEN